MKKVTMSVAALSIAIMSYGQTKTLPECCVKTVQEVYEYEGLTMDNSRIMFDKHAVREMIATLGDILEWQQQDMENGDTNMGSYEEEWGSNYWLTLMRDELIEKYNNQ